MKNFFTKIIALFLILSILAPYALQPQKAHAVEGVADTVIVIGDTSPTGLTNSLNHTLQHVKEFVLDGLANALMKQLAQQITNSIVNWINSGFDGSPGFVQNPSAFFLDVADQTTGDFIKNYDKGGILGQLCSPFSIDLRIALSFKYHPSYQKRYTCTLSTVIQNSKNAIKNASINGFTAGDFKQGGWPAFVSMTTEPQNNIYGAYLSADADISLSVAGKQTQKKDQLSQGRGFLSWEKCTAAYVAPTNSVSLPTAANQAQGTAQDFYNDAAFGTINPNGYDFANDASNGQATHQVTTANNYVEVNPQTTTKNCSIQTPGSVIAGSLDAHLSGPLRQLELANKINEIVNALFAQLASMVLQKGLGAISGSGPSDRSSYINQIQQSITTGNDNLNGIKSNLVKNIDRYLKNALTYKTYKDSSLAYLLSIKTKYEDARTCLATKPDTLDKPLTLAEIDNALLRIAPVITRLTGDAKAADDRYDSLLQIKTNVNATTTIDGVDQNANGFTNLVEGGESLLTDQDLKTAKNENQDILSSYRIYDFEATNFLQKCRTQN